MRTLALLMLVPALAFGQVRGWFLCPLVNANVQLDSLAYQTGDTLNPVAGGFSIATLNWKDSMALVLVQTSSTRIAQLASRFSYLGADTVAVKDSIVVKDGKTTPLIDDKAEIALPKNKGKVTATSLQQVMNAYKIPAVDIAKVSVGVKVKLVESKPIEEPIDEKPAEVRK